MTEETCKGLIIFYASICNKRNSNNRLMDKNLVQSNELFTNRVHTFLSKKTNLS